MVDYPNVICLRTFSKIFGLSALRLGWAYGAPEIIDVLNRIRGPFNISTPAMEAGIAAISDVAFAAATRAFNNRELAKLESGLRALSLTVHPSIANFVLVQFADAKQAKAACDFLMQRGLIVREVANYGLPECLRISVGLEEDNIAVLAGLREFLAA